LRKDFGEQIRLAERLRRNDDGPGSRPDRPVGAEAAKASGLPFLPGVQTVSEAMALSDLGFRLMKFFPAIRPVVWAG
jgi:hypothetical protein